VRCYRWGCAGLGGGWWRSEGGRLGARETLLLCTQSRGGGGGYVEGLSQSLHSREGAVAGQAVIRMCRYGSSGASVTLQDAGE